MSKKDDVLDLAIIGSGPAALTAALYAARAGLSVTVFERQNIGGALTEISKLANFPGFAGEGKQLAEQMSEQARKFGARIKYGECTGVEKLETESVIPERVRPTGSTEARSPVTTGATKRSGSTDSVFNLTIDGSPVLARSVLIATGTEPRQLDRELDKPVSYCALCDAPLYKGKDIIVVGGGNSAVGEAIYLADIVGHLTLVTHSALKAEPAAIAKLRSLPNVEIKENTELTDELVNATDAVFVFIGKVPATSFLPTEVLDDSGYIVTDDHFQTQLPGLYAAGDVRAGAIRQAITAAGEGAAAAVEIISQLKK